LLTLGQISRKVHNGALLSEIDRDDGSNLLGFRGKAIASLVLFHRHKTCGYQQMEKGMSSVHERG